SHCKAQQRLNAIFPPISVSPLPYSLPGRTPAGRRRATARHRNSNLLLSFPPSPSRPCLTLCLAEPLAGRIRRVGTGLACRRQHELEYPILEKTADGKLSSKPDYNRPLYEEKVKWCRKWVEHAVTNLGVGYDEDRDVFVFGNGILIDASDYAAGFKTTTIVLQ
ncbi:unnamed protein product, partial [Closterium sp. NIES-65]